MEKLNLLLNFLILGATVSGIWFSYHLYNLSGLRDRTVKDAEAKIYRVKLLNGLKADLERCKGFLNGHPSAIQGSSNSVHLETTEGYNKELAIEFRNIKNFSNFFNSTCQMLKDLNRSGEIVTNIYIATVNDLKIQGDKSEWNTKRGQLLTEIPLLLEVVNLIEEA